MSRPQDNPKEQERMTKQRDESESSESMSTNESDTSGELETMNVRIKDTDLYQVGNPAEGTAYVVNMHNTDHDGTVTCTCPDYRFRAQEGEHRACKHIQRVIQVSPSEITVDRLAYQQLVREYEILSDKIDSVSQDLTRAQSDGVSSSGQSQETGSVPASDAAGDGQQMANVSAEEAAKKLQAKFNEIVNGFNVEASNGLVWINKTPDAPETLPGPGNVETFYAFLADAELVQYDGDGTKNPPGQYFKNYLDPSDVDQYISEVLE